MVSLSNHDRSPFDKLRVIGLGALFLAGCATVGPSVSNEEVKSTQEYYETKSLQYSYGQVVRVRTVGERLTRSLPAELRNSKPKPYAGLILDELTPTSGRVFNIPSKGKAGCLIVGVLPGGPASLADLRAGDLMVQVNGKPTPTLRQATTLFGKLRKGEKAYLLIERDGLLAERTLVLVPKPYPVSFDVEDSEAVNAYATPGQIVVTSGLLRFIQSDDELAVVLGHELAHLTRGHIAKGMGPNILAGLVGATAGTAIDIVLPGAGDAITQATAAGVSAPFSQDFEREADYFGLRYTHQAGYRIEAALEFWDRFATQLPRSLSQSFFSTHPTSPERLLRLKKAIEEIQTAGAGGAS